MQFTSLASLLEYRAESDSNRPYLFLPENGNELTYGQVYVKAAHFAKELQNSGLNPGQRVALSLENGLNWLVAFWGILLAGAAVVPVNPRFKPWETEGILAQAGARFIVLAGKKGEVLPRTTEDVEESYYQLTGPRQPEIVIRSLPGDPAQTFVAALEQDSEAVLLFTSGSTGVPKGVVLSHGNLLAEANYIRQGHQLTAADRALCIMPFFHVNGLVITLITPVLTGGGIVVPARFSAKRFWGWVNQYQVTWLSAVPTILSILLSQEGLERPDASLRFVRSASASLPVALLEEFEQRFGVPVIEAYGLSEAGSQVATNPLPPAVRKAGSVGLPVGNELKVVDGDGVPVAPGTTGEVVVRGDNVTCGYLNNLLANRESFKEGWFYTGDLGYVDQEGYLFLAGRRKELINRAGEKISPREVDEILYRLAEVEVAAAVGVPDELFGEEVVAFIQLRPGAQLESVKVIEHCRTWLADFKVPKTIFYIESFPKGASGKIQRLKLVELYQQLKTEGTTI